jgi:hypothetical protein
MGASVSLTGTKFRANFLRMTFIRQRSRREPMPTFHGEYCFIKMGMEMGMRMGWGCVGDV